MYCLHLAVYNSVLPQAPTRGQDNTSVEISEGEKVGGRVCVGGGGGGEGSFPPLEVLDLYPGAAAG